MDGFGERYFAQLAPNERMIDYMRELRERGYKLAICTNNVREWEQRWRAMLPVDEIFDVVVDSAFVGIAQARAAHLRAHARAARGRRRRRAAHRRHRAQLHAARGSWASGRSGFSPPSRPSPRSRPRCGRRASPWAAGSGGWRGSAVRAPLRRRDGRRRAAQLHGAGPRRHRLAGGQASTIGPAIRPTRAIPPSSVSVSDHAVGAPIPSGFLGFSFEFQGVRAYTGSDPAHINPVLVQLIRNLTPGQAPVLRIGGNSTDVSYVAGRGVKPLPYVGYQLTPSWMATTGALARQLGARMIMGLNLAANDPALDAAELRDYVNALGENAIDAVEIGNEPNVYNKITVYRTAAGAPVHARPRSFGYPAFRPQFEAIARRTAAPGAGRAGAGGGPEPGEGLLGQHRLGPAAARAAAVDDDRAPLPAAQLLRAAELAAVPDDLPSARRLRHGHAGRQPEALDRHRPRPAPPDPPRRAQFRGLPRQGGGQRHLRQRPVGHRRPVRAGPGRDRRGQPAHPAQHRLRAVRLQPARRPLAGSGAPGLLRA